VIETTQGASTTLFELSKHELCCLQCPNYIASCKLYSFVFVIIVFYMWLKMLCSKYHPKLTNIYREAHSWTWKWSSMGNDPVMVTWLYLLQPNSIFIWQSFSYQLINSYTIILKINKVKVENFEKHISTKMYQRCVTTVDVIIKSYNKKWFDR